MTKYSIVLPAFNSEKTIARAIQSVLNQKNKDWELIVVDDESVDKTGEIVKEFCEKHKNIFYFRQKNGGPGIARNLGIKKSRSEYICFLDSDDYWSDDFLLEIDSKVKEKPYDIIFYDIVRETSDGKAIGYSHPSRFKNRSKEELLVLQGSGTLEWGMTKVVKSKLIKDHDIYFSDLPVGEEAIFSVQILKHCKYFSFVEKDIYHYINSDSSQHNSGELDPWNKVVEAMEEYLKTDSAIPNKDKMLDSLSLKALVINVNRICLANKYKTAKKEIKNSVLRYKTKRVNLFRCKKSDLETTIWFVKTLLKIRCYFLIYCLAKLRG